MRPESPSSEIAYFLEQTAWGCQGLRYHVRDYDRAWSRLPHPQFVALQESGRLLGTVMFFLKSVSVGAKKLRCAYLTQLSVHPESRGQGLAGRLVKEVSRHMQHMYPDEPTLITAYIEEANIPSLSVFRKEGFHDVGQFHGTVINRVYPKPCAQAKSLEPHELLNLRRELVELYGDHALADFETSLRTDEYRVIRDGSGAILAGLQEHPEEWRVTQMEGLSGWLVVNILGKTSWIQEHIFNPTASRFIHIGNLYAREGHEHLLYLLIEDALVRHDVPFAVGYFDKTSPFYERFASAGSFGFLNAQLETPVRAMAQLNGIAEKEIAELKRRPLVISPLDIS